MNNCFPSNQFIASDLMQQRLTLLQARNLYIRDYLIPRKFIIPCTIRILFVTDDFGSFDKVNTSGLGHFLTAFDYDPANNAVDNPAAYINFSYKTAHRGSEPCDFPNFKFDTHDLNQYDQIWLFGTARSGDFITGQELIAITRFMDEGGGIFATGDHEHIGVDLCGKIPRVRCMRRWWFNSLDPANSPDPEGSPPAPPVATIAGINNHNTIGDNPATGINEALISSNQADNYPQNILPRYRRDFFRGRVYPHPVLCGPNGPIKVMPDHMHEGKCDIYNDFEKILHFDTIPFTEFPLRSGSSAREIPTVIADNINQLDNSRFESISVYDGHNTDAAGRILCDSTWHHFFKINLQGFEASRARVRAGTGTPEDFRSENDYVNIRAYFRNIAYWISRRSNQECMRKKGYHIVIRDVDFRIIYKPLDLVPDKMNFFYSWGVLAKDSLNQLAPQCQWIEWILWIIRDNSHLYEKLRPIEIEKQKEIQNYSGQWFDLEKIHLILVGKAMYNLYEFIIKEKEISEETYEQFDKITMLDLKETLKNTLSEMAKELKSLQTNLKT